MNRDDWNLFDDSMSTPSSEVFFLSTQKRDEKRERRRIKQTAPSSQESAYGKVEKIDRRLAKKSKTNRY